MIPFATMALAPYLANAQQVNILFSSSSVYTNKVRMCPGGANTLPPYCKGTWDPNTSGVDGWNCWIGANFGGYGNPVSAPFYYADQGVAPMKASTITKPAAAMMFMDTITHYVYNPVDPSYRFVLDMNGDGIPDTMAQYPDTAFNSACPLVHSGKSDVALLDGHVERVPFSVLWQVDKKNGNVACPFWYMQYPNAEFATP